MFRIRKMRKIVSIAALSLFGVMLFGIGSQVQAQTSTTAEASFLNLENLLTYSPVQHAIISNVLTLGYAAMAAGLVYFLATLARVSPRYRLSTVLAAVVMTSAFLELFQLFQDWESAFTFTGGVWQSSNDAFSNGFRYMNWSIDVPMLLLQLVIVLGLSRARAVSAGTQFVIGGLLMIYTGYIGQFYETSDNLTWFWVWFVISSVFYLYILFVLWRVISGSLNRLPENAAGIMKIIPWYILIIWSLYPIAYVIPAIWPMAWGAVTRQIIFTIADITSKVIYGALISRVATYRSAAEGYEPAMAALKD